MGGDIRLSLIVECHGTVVVPLSPVLLSCLLDSGNINLTLLFKGCVDVLFSNEERIGSIFLLALLHDILLSSDEYEFSLLPDDRLNISSYDDVL